MESSDEDEEESESKARRGRRFNKFAATERENDKSSGNVGGGIGLLDNLLDMDAVTGIDWDAVMVVLQSVLDTAPHSGHGPILELAMRMMPRVTRATAGMMVVTCLQSLPLPGPPVSLRFFRLN